jgi:hypothetical protein
MSATNAGEVVDVSGLVTVRVALVVLFAVLVSGLGVVTVAMYVYVPAVEGAVSSVPTVADAPAKSVPTVSVVTRDVAPPAASEIVTATESAAAVPMLATRI